MVRTTAYRHRVTFAVLLIFGVGNHIGALFQEAGKHQLKVAVANDAIKDALFGDEIPLILGDERLRVG